MLKAHLDINGVYVECNATVRACPRGGKETHKEFKDINEMNDYNEKLIASRSTEKKLGKNKNSKAITEQSKLKQAAIKNRMKINKEKIAALADERAEFESRANKEIGEVLSKIKSAVAISYDTLSEVKKDLDAKKEVNIDDIKLGLNKMEENQAGFRMNDFLDEESSLKLQATGSADLLDALDNKKPYDNIQITPNDENSVLITASTADPNYKEQFTISGVIPMEKYRDGINKSYEEAASDYDYVDNKGNKPGEDSWPKDVKGKIERSNEIIGRTSIGFDFIKMTELYGHDANSLIVEEYALNKKEQELKNNLSE